MMRTGLVVDCGCELSTQYLDQHNITVLPAIVRFNDHEFLDDRDEAKTADAYRQGLDNLVAEEAAGSTIEMIKARFLDSLVTKYDYVFILTSARSRAPLYEHCSEASVRILNEYRPIRESAGIKAPFAMRVLDSQNLGAGYAALASAVMQSIREGDSPGQIRATIYQLLRSTYSYYVFRDIGIVRRRLMEKGNASIGWMQARLVGALDLKPVLRWHDNVDKPMAAPRGFERAAARAFDFINRRIRKGLLVPTVSVAYGGPPDELWSLPGFEAMARTAQEHGVTLHTTMQSVSAAAYCSPGSLNFGFVSEAHRYGH